MSSCLQWTISIEAPVIYSKGIVTFPIIITVSIYFVLLLISSCIVIRLFLRTRYAVMQKLFLISLSLFLFWKLMMSIVLFPLNNFGYLFCSVILPRYILFAAYFLLILWVGNALIYGVNMYAKFRNCCSLVSSLLLVLFFVGSVIAAYLDSVCNFMYMCR
jgi:hypothetical protein